MIRIQQVSKSIDKKKVLEDISFEVKRGQCVALIGENGAGKTTLMNCLLGASVDNGHILINNTVPQSAQLKYQLGVLMQDNILTDKLTVQELIHFYRAIYPKPLSEDSIKQLLKFTSQQLKQFVAHLSGGQKRLLSFVLTLIGQPKILLLDEPTAAMDTNTRLHFWQIIEALKKQGVTILYTSHYIEEIEHTADYVVVLNKGKLVHHDTVYHLRQANIMKLITVPIRFKEVVMNYNEATHIEVHSDHISFMTERVGEIYQQLTEAGCTIEDMEISRQTLLNTLFNIKESAHE